MSKFTVLIIENDLKLKESMMTTVQKMDHKALACSRMGEAIQLLSEMKKAPVFVLAKMHMPDMTGVDFLKQARLKNFKISVCFYAYQIERTELISALQYGALDVVRAPLSSDFFKTKLPMLLQISSGLGSNFKSNTTPSEVFNQAEQKMAEFQKTQNPIKNVG